MHLRRDPVCGVIALLTAIGVCSRIIARFPDGRDAGMDSLCDYTADWPSFQKISADDDVLDSRVTGGRSWGGCFSSGGRGGRGSGVCKGSRHCRRVVCAEGARWTKMECSERGYEERANIGTEEGCCEGRADDGAHGGRWESMLDTVEEN